MRASRVFLPILFPIILTLISIFLALPPTSLSQNLVAWQKWMSTWVDRAGGLSLLFLLALLIILSYILVLLQLYKLPKAYTWDEMSKTIRHEIEELRQKVLAGLIKQDFERDYLNVQRNILALATRITLNRMHHLSSNWMSFDESTRSLWISSHQGFYSYMGRRRTFIIDSHKQGSCALAFQSRKVYICEDALKDKEVCFLDTVPDEKETLRALINIPIPEMPKNKKGTLQSLENHITGDSPLPFEIKAVINIDSPFKGVFKKQVIKKRIAELIEIGSMLLDVRLLPMERS